MTYDLVKFLRQRFQPDEQRALYKVQLKNRRRKPGEKLDELAQSILKLARNAFPHAPNEWRETAVKDQFIEDLTDADLRRQVYSMFPKTLHDALAGAVQLEAFYQDERSRNSRKQIVRTVEGANESQHEFKSSIGPYWECGLMGHYRSCCPPGGVILDLTMPGGLLGRETRSDRGGRSHLGQENKSTSFE